ncbi:MAG: 2-keto-4-pentenoate hydratase [bacterium]
MQRWPRKFLQAYSKRHRYDSISAEFSDLSIADAYDIQRQYVVLRDEPITGYKAALTAPAGQMAMGVDHPVVGVLLASGIFSADKPVEAAQQILLETEIGFVTASDISEPVMPDSVLDFMAGCKGVVELASPNLASKPNGLDLIATNSASFGYIEGQRQAIPGRHVLDATAVSLEKDGEILMSGTAGEVMGGQLDALCWLINQTLELGYTIEAGHLLLTGSIGGVLPGQPGNYRARYGDLGQIDFSLPATP